MSKLAVIRDILHTQFRHPNQACLTEKDKDAKGKEFEVQYKIVKKPQIEYELFRYELEAFPFFNDVSDLKKMCDYILFAEEGTYLYIFVIELKLGNKSAQKQLEAAREFVQFIINSANRIGKKIENYKIRKVRICDEKIKKRKTREDRSFEFDDNDYCEYSNKDFCLEPLMRY